MWIPPLICMHFMQIVSNLAGKIFQIVSFTPHVKCDQCTIPGVW